MATLGAVGDILTTMGSMWYAPVGTAVPDETSIAYGADWGGAWDQLTVLSAPLTMEYTEVREEADEQDALSPVADWRIDERFLLRSATDRMTGDLLALLTHGSNTDTAAGGSQKAYSRVLGGGEPVVNQYAVGFEGYRPDDTDGTKQPVRYFFYKASFMLDRGFQFSKREKTSIPFSVKVYADSSKSVGQQTFEWHIVTDATT